MRDHNVGSIPVVVDQQTRKLVGIVDLCCAVIAAGLDPKTTPIEKYMSSQLVTCRNGETVKKCARAMQEHQLTRIPLVDSDEPCVGIVSLTDVALKDKPEKASRTLTEISKPGSRRSIAA